MPEAGLNNLFPKQGGNEKFFDVLEFVSSIDDCSEEDIQNFINKRVIPSLRGDFGKKTTEKEEEARKIYTTIDKLSKAELEKLWWLLHRQNDVYVPGAHSLRGALSIMYFLTGDNKYKE